MNSRGDKSETTIDRARLPGIQILRGLAAMLVVFCHATAQIYRLHPQSDILEKLVTFGASGVDIFFVISGFIIFYIRYSIPNAERPKTKEFLWRRAFRIYPIYWVTITAMITLSAAGFFSSVNLSGLGSLMSYLLLPQADPILPISWTLTYELYFYLIFAAFLWARNPLIALTGVGAAILLSLAVGRLLPASTLQGFLSQDVMLEFLGGMALAFLFIKRLGPWLPPAWLIIPAFGFLLCSPWFLAHEASYAPAWRSLKWGPAALVMVAALIVVKDQKTFWFRCLGLVGDASYSIYMTHVFVTGAFHFLLERTALRELNPVAGIVGVCGLSIILGVITHLMFEKPLMKFERRMRLRQQTSPLTP
jgi:exopolysaccharide production protein ExoZ